jgi:hypothetical protein
MLNIQGNLWARLAYQFAHEYCHTLANPRSWPGPNDRFSWVEEVLGEIASLFALVNLAKSWASAPPFPQWKEYAPKFLSYLSERVDAKERTLPAGEEFPSWFPRQLQPLELNFSDRDRNTIIAKELLPVFELEAGKAWHSVEFLHEKWVSDGSLEAFFSAWAEACPLDSCYGPKEVAARLGLSL